MYGFFVDTVITEPSYDTAVKHLNSFDKTFFTFLFGISKKLRINVCQKSTKIEKRTLVNSRTFVLHLKTKSELKGL